MVLYIACFIHCSVAAPQKDRSTEEVLEGGGPVCEGTDHST